MNVRQLLGKKGMGVFTISPNATVLESLRMMEEHNLGSLVVLEDGDVVGLITERDYARKVILQGKSSSDTPVLEIMTTEIVAVTSKESVDSCMALMTERRVRHLPVIENGQLAGIVSIGDVVKAIIERQQHEIEELEGYIHRGR